MSADLKAKVANPGPLGLLGFGMTTVLLNLHNAGLLPLSIAIVAMGIALGGLAQIIAGIREGIDPNQDQGPPEQAVGSESGTGKGVALAQLADTGDNLSQTAQRDTHSDDHDGQGQQTGIMQVQQNSGHAEAQQTQRAGVGDLCFQISRHDNFLHV